jgi:hypothetical protein
MSPSIKRSTSSLFYARLMAGEKCGLELESYGNQFSVYFCHTDISIPSSEHAIKSEIAMAFLNFGLRLVVVLLAY